MHKYLVNCIHNFPRTGPKAPDIYYHSNNRLNLLFTAVFNTISLSAATPVNYYSDYYKGLNRKKKR
jgi:hypothetical protein